jgi:hypothetical protein
MCTVQGTGLLALREPLMLKWTVFALLWIAGLFVGDVLAASGLGGNGSRLVFFGGMWMLACLGAKDVIEGYQKARANRKRPNY